jgi:CRP/FNR family transcriptional regulator, cyclic AMP receptor protein
MARQSARAGDLGAELGATEWFRGLPADLQRRILAGGRARHFARGQVFQREDTPSSGLICILSGRAALSRFTSRGAEALIHVAGPGFWFGEIGVFTGDTLISATAQTPVRAFVLSKPAYDRILDEQPRYFEAFARMTIERYRLLLRFLAETLSLAPDVRLRIRLADLADIQLRDSSKGDAGVVLGLSQSELGSIVGLSRQKLNIRLRRLQEQGWIEVGHRFVRVLDPIGLRATALEALVVDDAH